MEFHSSIETLPELSGTVVTVGTFDGLHCGHRKLINTVIERAKILQVASVLITFNPHPKEVLLRKKKVSVELLTTIREKKEILQQEFNLSHIVILPFTTSFSQISASDFLQNFLINPFNPSEIILGYDHRFGRGREGDADFLREREDKYDYSTDVVEAVQSGDGESISSSRIRELLHSGEMLKVQEYLARPYCVTGTVEAGAKRGRELNFPTANIRPENEHKLIPADGIYLVYVTSDVAEGYGLCSIGVRPTFDDNQHTIEVYLLDSPQESLYSRQLTIHFFNRLRREEKFESADALIKQMERDQEQGEKLIAKHNPWKSYQEEQLNAIN